MFHHNKSDHIFNLIAILFKKESNSKWKSIESALIYEKMEYVRPRSWRIFNNNKNKNWKNKGGRKMNEACYVLHLDISDAKNLKFKIKLSCIMSAISFTTAPYIGFHQWKNLVW